MSKTGVDKYGHQIPVQIAFLSVCGGTCDYGRPKDNVFLDGIYRRGNHVVFVTDSELWRCDTNKYAFSRVMGTCPAVAEPEFVSGRRQGHPQTEYGLYYDTQHLLLMDDVVAWSHHRLNFKDIRTAKDVAIAKYGVHNRRGY